MILGDFNRTDIKPLCLGNCLTQVVNKPTRGDAILDLIITDMSNLYHTPNVTSPIGRSDHSCVSWFPKSSRPINVKVKHKIQTFSDSQICMFGRWIQSQTWNEISSVSDVQSKADAFYCLVNGAISTIFPVKSVTSHTTDKPWMTDRIKGLIVQRQRAFAQGDKVNWSKLRNQVIREIKKT